MGELRNIDHQGDGSLSIELYLREDVFGARTRQRETLDRVESLEESSIVEETAAYGWPDRVEPDQAPDHGVPIDEFVSWAADRVDLEPAFERRVDTSSITGETVERIVLPIMCLAVYEGDSLACVAPHVDGVETYTVGDCLDDLEAMAESGETEGSTAEVEPIGPAAT